MVESRLSPVASLKGHVMSVEPYIEIRAAKSRVLHRTVGFYYVLIAANYEVVFTSETFSTEWHARRAADRAKEIVRENDCPVRGVR